MRLRQERKGEKEQLLWKEDQNYNKARAADGNFLAFWGVPGPDTPHLNPTTTTTTTRRSWALERSKKNIPQENAKIEISLQKKVDTGIVFLASCILGTSSWVEAASFRQTPTHQKNIYLELSTDSKYKPPKI